MDHAEALLKAIRFFGSETAMGKALNVSQQRISYWVNSGRQISYDYVLRIEAYTKGHVTRHELAPDKKEVNQLIGELTETNINYGLLMNKKSKFSKKTQSYS